MERPPPIAGSTLRKRPSVSHAAGERLLLVPLEKDVADLGRAVVLTGTARRIWENGSTTAAASARSTIASTGSVEIDHEVRAFLADLAAHGLVEDEGGPLVEPSRREAESHRPEGKGSQLSEPADAEIDAESFEALARAVLEGGHLLRFRARGASMRPFLPDGSVLEVRACPFTEPRSGDLVLYRAGRHRLVAHRVIGREDGRILARGDSAPRVDAVGPEDLLGLVVARLRRRRGRPVRRIALATPLRRLAGRLAALGYRMASASARALLVGPLGASPLLRRAFRGLLAVASGVLRRLEAGSSRLRHLVDVVRSALLTTEEKDAGRARLYSRRAVQDFTALDENVEAGLTLIEEVLLVRHPLPGSRVLVLGCGPGREAVALARRGFAVTGVDRSSGMLARARVLAEREGVVLELVEADAGSFGLPERFDAVLLFSGLYDMVLPRARRVALLARCRAHLAPGGRILLTFLSDYVPPGSAASVPGPSLLRAINPEHEAGDRFLLNEAVHIFPHPDHLVREAREAGLKVVEVYRDQRAYDRATRQVRGYAVLEEPEAVSK